MFERDQKMPFPRSPLWPTRLAALASLALAVTFGSSQAQNVLPTHGVVTSGAASIGQSGANLSVTQTSPRAIVNWGSFSIGQGNGVTFDQPSASSAILNRVTGSTTSTIAGQLQANGQVYLVNPNGIAITKTGAVQVGGGFVASTLGIADNDFNNGNLNFVGKGASAGVSNAGSIAAAPGGFVGLLGGTVANSGVVSVPLGKVGMGSGEQATLNLTGDNFLQVAVPTNTKTADGQALVDVSGKVRAAGGSVQLRAATVAQAIRNAVNVPGELSVTSARASGGSIILGGGPGGNVSVTGRLKASGRTAGGTIAISGHDIALRQAKLAAASAKGRGGAVTVTGTHAVSLASSLVDASGATGGGAIRIGGDFHGASDLTSAQTTTIDSASTLNASATASGDGGTVAVWSDATTNFAGRITATGGASGGNGGSVEVSANPATHGVLSYSGFADLTAPKGKTGTLLLDPFDIVISAAPDSGGTFAGGVYTPTATSFINTATLVAQLGAADVTISTGLAGSPGADAGNMTVASPIAWASDNSLTLIANNNLLINAAISNTGAGDLALQATNLVSIANPIAMGSGLITVTGPTLLAANVTTSELGILFNNAVTLGADVTVDSGAGAATNTTFVGPVDGGHVLTVTGGGALFQEAVGSITPLAGLNVTGPATLTGSVTTASGAITFNGATLLNGNVVIDSGAATTTFGGAVNSFCLGCELFTPPVNLAATAGAFSFGGPMGSTNALAAVSLTSPSTMTLPSITAASLAATSTAGGITLSGPLAITGTASLNAAEDIVQQGAATVDPTNLTMVSTTGGITLNAPVAATGSVTLTAANDIIEIAGAPGPVLLPSGSIVTPTLSATSAAGRVVLTLSNTVGSVSGSAPAGFSFFNDEAIGVGGAGISSTAGSIALETITGSITQTGPVRGLALFADAGSDGTGNVVLNNPTNAVGTLAGGASGNFEFANNNGANLAIGTVNYFVSSDTDVPNASAAFGLFAFGSAAPGAIVQVSNVGNLVLNTANPAFLDVPSVHSFDPTGLILLAATGNFTNNFGPGAIVESTPAIDPWQIYSASPTGDFFNGLDSGNTAVWNTTFGEPVTAAGERYVFAFRPTITVTSGDLTKSYGQDATSSVASDFTITGLQPGVAGAFLPDAAAAVFSGTPSVTSLGSPASASVAGGPYPITVAPGSFAVSDNYALVLDSAGRLTVDPLAISYSVADANSIFGTTPILGAATLFGVLPGDAVDPTVGAFKGPLQIPLSPFTPVGQYLQMVTALSNPNYVIAASGNSPGTLTVAPTPLVFRPFDPGFLPGLTQINNPAQTQYDVGGYEQVLPRFTVACNEPPSLPDPNRFSDPDTALRAISQSMENYFRRCQNPTQSTIGNALDAYAAKLQVLAPRLPPALRNVPTIIAQAAKRVRAASTRAEAVAVLRQTVAEVHKEIALVLSEDPQTRSREVRDGDVIAGALGDANVALVNSGGL
jgi:filamentous hemagglutinin family protein